MSRHRRPWFRAAHALTRALIHSGSKPSPTSSPIMMVGVIQVPPAFVIISSSFVGSAFVSTSVYGIPACESHAFASSQPCQIEAV
jgi:hypothetical protein